MLCSALALSSLAQADVYEMIWAPGVSLEKGWKDVNKVMDEDDFTGDSSLCWAASASNILAWWQEQNASHLKNHQAGIPQGEEAIFEAFNNAFYNVGIDGYTGLRWFMDGGSEIFAMEVDEGYTMAEACLDPKGTAPGGYYNGVVEDIVSTMGAGSPVVTDDVPPWIALGVLSLQEFTSQLVDAVTNGAVSLGIYGTGPGGLFGHAITLWGVNLNKTTGLVESMWVTDSDDLKTFGEDLKLFELKCSSDTKKVLLDDGYHDYEVYAIEDTLPEDGKRWYGGKDMYNEYIDSFGFLKANVQWVVPEPATGTLGLLALAALAARRRRKG